MARIAYPPGGGGGGGAPTDAQYVVLAANGTLTDERILTPGTGLDLTDAGAGGAATLDLDLSELATQTLALDDTIPFADTSAGAPNNGKATAQSLLVQLYRESPRHVVRFYSDFLQETSTTLVDGALAEIISGTGAAVNALAGNAQHPGIARLQCGTTATGRASLSSTLTALRFGGGEWFYEAVVNVTTLSTLAERFQSPLGFVDTMTAANQVDGAYFLYDEGGVSTGSAASANWQIVTANNSARTFTTTSVAVTAGQWYRLRIVVNAAGTNVDFSIDGVAAGSHTTNIPTAAGRETGFGCLLIKSAGLTGRTVDHDYINVVGTLTTAR